MVTTRQSRSTVATKAPRKAIAKKAPLKNPKLAASTQAVKGVKVKKPKLIRDSFTIPKDEYLVIDSLKARAEKLAHPMKKSELLRAGIKALAAMSDAQFKTVANKVQSIKTGRPKSSK